MTKKQRLYSWLQTFILLILFVSMVVMSVIYIFRSQEQYYTEDIALSDEKLRIIRNDAYREAVENVEMSFWQPMFVGFRFSSNGQYRSNGFLGNNENLSSVFEIIKPYLYRITEKKSVCISLEKSYGQSLWEQCILNNSYIYLRFFEDIPVAFLHYFCFSAGNEITSSYDGDVYVREVFFRLSKDEGKSFSYNIILRDSKENYAVFSFDNETKMALLDASLFDAYTDSNMGTSFQFVLNDEQEIAMNPFDIRIENMPKSSKIRFEDCRESFYPIDFQENDQVLSLLSFFGYNTDFLNRYYEADGSVVYHERFGNIRITPESSIEFLSADMEKGGLLITDYLGYVSEDGTYDFYEILSGTERIVAILYSEYRDCFGGDAEIRFQRAYVQDDKLHIEFSYYQDNYCILGAPGIKFVIDGLYITNMTLSPFCTTRTGSAEVLSQLWSYHCLNEIYGDISDGFLIPAYVMDGISQESVMVSWGLEKVKE